MYKLSKLPIEILYIIGDYLDTSDLITMARLNSWFGYKLSVILGERIQRYVRKEGWRIHIDILAKSYPSHQAISPSLPFSTELLLLSEYCSINPFTLELEFSLCPIDENGLEAIENATRNERSIVILDKIKTNVDIVAYFAQISDNQRLQYVNQAGAAIMNDKHLWSHSPSTKTGLAVMGSGFKIQYDMTTRQDKAMTQLVQKFQTDYRKHNKDASVLTQEEEEEAKAQSAVISFDSLKVSPEWWIKQMKVPCASSHEQQEPGFMEHGYW